MKQILPRNIANAIFKRPSQTCRNFVVSILREQNQPLTIQELYAITRQRQEAEAQAAGAASDAQPVIPSMRYLKRTVMPYLASIKQVEKVHTKAVLTPEEVEALKARQGKGKKPVAIPTHVELWRWQLKAPEPAPPPVQEEKRFGEEIGVGASVAHLNKRRQRAREEKVKRDFEWLKQLERARRVDATPAEASS